MADDLEITITMPVGSVPPWLWRCPTHGDRALESSSVLGLSIKVSCRECDQFTYRTI